MHMHARKLQTLLVAGALTSALWSATMASAAPAAVRKEKSKEPVKEVIVERAALPGARMWAGAGAAVAEAAIDNQILSLLNKLNLTNEQLDKALALTQKAIGVQQDGEKQIRELLAAQRAALLAGDEAAVEKNRRELAEARRSLAEKGAELRAQARELLTNEQRKVVAQALPWLVDVQASDEVRRRATFERRVAPERRSAGAMWWRHGVRMPMRMGMGMRMPHMMPYQAMPSPGGDYLRTPQQPPVVRQLPRWHPDRELPAQRVFIGRGLGIGGERGASSTELLRRLEKLLKELQTARAGQTATQKQVVDAQP